jgi:hypothetical protein
MTPAEEFAALLLDRTAALLAPPGAWIQGAHARLPDRETNVPPLSHLAGCWCALGGYIRIKAITSAIDMETRSEGLKIANAAIDAELEVRRAESGGRQKPLALTTWNDAYGREQREVVELFRDAAARVRKGSAS